MPHHLRPLNLSSSSDLDEPDLDEPDVDELAADIRRVRDLARSVGTIVVKLADAGGVATAGQVADLAGAAVTGEELADSIYRRIFAAELPDLG